MSWISLLIAFVKSIIVDVFMKAQETPAIKEEVDVQEGTAVAPDPDFYAGLYGMQRRD